MTVLNKTTTTSILAYGVGFAEKPAAAPPQPHLPHSKQSLFSPSADANRKADLQWRRMQRDVSESTNRHPILIFAFWNSIPPRGKTVISLSKVRGPEAVGLISALRLTAGLPGRVEII